MSAEIRIQISDQVARRAAEVATSENRSVEEVLAAWLDQVVNESPVENLSDAEVVTLTQMQLAPDQDAEFSGLLEGNREGALNDEGQQRLDELMRVYEQGLMRKAQALKVAVQRGLREPLQQ